MLSSLVREETAADHDIFSSTEETSSSFASVFDEPLPVQEKKDDSDPGTPINFSGFMNLVNNKERKQDPEEDFPEIISY